MLFCVIILYYTIYCPVIHLTQHEIIRTQTDIKDCLWMVANRYMMIINICYDVCILELIISINLHSALIPM